MALPNPFENFTNMITDWFKDLQIYVDNLSPVPDADNSMFPLIGIPYHFDTTVLVSATVSNFTNYTDSAHGYGYQNIGFSHRLTLINGDLRCTNLQLQGKIATGNPGTWSKLTEAEQADALEKAQQLLKVGVHNNYPDSKIGFSTYSLGSFGFTVIGHSTTDMHYKFEDKNGEHINTLYTCSATKTNNEITDNGDGTISGPFSDITLGGRNFTRTTPTIVLFGNDTNAQDFVSRMQSTNRDVFNHVCVSGATYKVYVGETYLVYVIDNTKVYTFYDLYDGTKTATQKINDWTPGSPVIQVPTYNDVKYGPEPPEPSTDDDDTDGQDFGAGSSLGGSDMLWLLTAQQMSDFHTALNGGITTGFNPFDSIISVMGLAIPPTYILDDIEVVTNIVIPKSDGTSWSSGVNGHICTSQKSAFGFVNLSLDRLYNNFLDFSPYSTHEIFIPMCGWLPLPDIAVNRTLCVYYVPDIQNCSVRGLVGIYGDGGKVDIIGEKYGAMGAEVPITNNGHALFISGAISGGVQTLANGLNGVFGAAGTNNPWFGGSGLMSAIATGTQSMMNTQRNISSVIGQNQDRSAFSDGTHIMIKSSYPQIKLDPLYGHTHGFVCYRSGQLSEFSGFTICENPHISGITCTSDEKDEIAKLLESGVILPAGE